ncbi:MAG: tetratricopeptide repeat protein [Spirochaetaceae bacterium]
MKQPVFLFLVIIILLSGCAGTEEAEEPNDQFQIEIRRRAQLYERARNLINRGTPKYLEEGLELLASEDLQTTERGAEAAYAALNIRRIVYPYLEPLEYGVSLPSGSVYNNLFAGVKEGTNPNIVSSEISFLTLLISSLTLLTGKDSEVRSQAGERVKDLVEINPDSLLALYLRGVVHRRDGQLKEAADTFIRIVEEDSSCYPALLDAVEIGERRGRALEVLPYAEDLLEDFPEERDVIRNTVKVFINIGRYERADTLLSEAISRYSDDGDLLLYRAVLLERMGEVEKAMRLANALEKEGGESAETLLVRGRVALREERFEKAEEVAEQGISEYPENYEFTLLLSNFLVDAGRGEEAYTVLSEKWNESPDNMELLSSLLDVSIRIEKWEEGEEYLKRLLEYSGEEYSTLRTAVRFYRGEGELKKALEYSEKIVELFPDRRQAVDLYLELLVAAGEKERLLEYADTGISESDSSEVRSLLYYYQSEVQENIDERIESLQSALFENMQNIRALIRISELYSERGETAKAARYLRQAVAARPEDRELRDRLRSLESRLE